MAYAAVPAPQQLQSWLVLATGALLYCKPQVTYRSYCGSAGFACGSCAGPSKALKPHPTQATSTSACPLPTRGRPNPAAGLPAEPRTLQYQLQAPCLHLGSPHHQGGGLSMWCPREIPAQTVQIAPGSRIRTADFLMPARGLGTGLEDFVSIISPAPAPRGFALWAWRASW